MFKHLFTTTRRSNAGWCLATCLFSGLALLALSSFRQHGEPTSTSAGNRPHEQREQVVNQNETNPVPRHFTGAAARKYLQQPGEGQSLMQAITAARFGLKSQEHGPFGEPGRGYLGMSHDQNLNAWFAEDGVTVRPTVAEEERARAWHVEMRLKAYGYGNDLVAAPPIVSQQVKDNRIEYERGNFELRNANFESMKSDLSFISQSAIRNPQLIEWYENRAEGIEQGFTIGERPQRHAEDVPDEPLRLVISLNGDLQAHAKDGGQTIELTDSLGKPALSYSKLTALDADNRQLSAHMEASPNGTQIVLVVDDRNASYPIVIDPIAASLEKILDPGSRIQTGMQFGDAVAIYGDRAIVGAWLYDASPSVVDSGMVWIFKRVGSTWSESASFLVVSNHSQCGYSVAIGSTFGAFGCPGANTNTGQAFITNYAVSGSLLELVPLSRNPGDFFGASVATSASNIVVGAPLTSVVNGVAGDHIGAVHLFDGSTWIDTASQFAANEQFGFSVTMEFSTLLVGAPAAMSGTGRVVALTLNGGKLNFQSSLKASDGAAGDQFGTGVAFSVNSAIIGAPGDDDKGPEAGAAYVFVRDAANQWSQQQKLTAGDTRAGDIFGYNSVAIEANTVVVGARRHDSDSSTPNDNSGAAYIFGRTGTVWTQQTKLTAGGLFRGPGDEFGSSVGISSNTVIVGSPHEASGGLANAGATYVYRLDCVPPSQSIIAFSDPLTGNAACPGQSFGMGAFLFSGTYQWRRNGVNIPGATSGSYQISNVTAADAGVYDVIRSNACGSEISLPATLNVHTFSLSPNQNISASGSPGLISVTCTGACNFTAVSNSPFVTITSGATGTAPGTVGFTVAANTGPNQRTATVTIGDKTFTVTQDAAAPGPTPSPNVVQFSASNYSVQEDCTTVTITVNRIGDTSGAASVDYNTSDITATERKDYITALGTLRFAVGETSKSFAILVNEDSFVEGNETFSVNLSNPVGVSIGGPAITTVTITDDVSEPAANSIDDAQNYVCQHYHDFLNRQPDAAGLQFWTNQITACGTDQACIETRRINVSASFFLSIEFQDTGYLVERIYKAAYGDAAGNSTFPSAHQLAVPVVRLNEFLSDTQEIGQGVIVGQGNWQQQIENNKQAFTASFIQRSRFTSAFPLSLTATQFVDLLNANAGNPLSSSERNQLVIDLSTSAKTRAQVLRAVAEDSDLNSAESNRAFVLMQYFGYLRRHPNDRPDSDHTGYDFWLTKLNQFNGNYINAEMVKAFITSIEYRQRFGP